MRVKKHLILIILFGFILMAFSFSILPVRNVQAQCKNVSSCKNCHEIQSIFPVANNGLWHDQHALYDFCDVCHGGDKNAPDKLTAHAGIKSKFSELTQACTNCHSSDLDQRINSYSDALGVQVQIPLINVLCTPTPAFFQGSGIFSNPGLGDPSATLSPQSSGSNSETQLTVQKKPIVNTTGNTILKVLLVLMVLGGFIFIYQNEKHNFLPSNKDREKIGDVHIPFANMRELTRKIDSLSPEGQIELRQLLDDPVKAEQLLHELNQSQKSKQSTGEK